MTDWTKYALGRSADKFTNLKDAAFISVGGPNWINPNINTELEKAMGAGVPAIAVYIVEVEIYTQIFNTPDWKNWDQEADPYYSGKGNHNAYLRGMLKGKGFCGIMFDIRNVKGSAEAWIRAVICYLDRLSVNEHGLKTFVIADKDTYISMGPDYTGNTNVNDYLMKRGSNAIICYVNLDGEYPAEGAIFFFGPAPAVDWILYGNGMWLYKPGNKDRLFSDLGFIPGEESETEPENIFVRLFTALINFLEAFLEGILETLK